jgi:hypothetical protein
MNVVHPWEARTSHIMEGLYESLKKWYLDLPDGIYYGELIGPKVNGNPYDLDQHIWIPFLTYARESLAYSSWGKYGKTYEDISKWFETHIFSLYYRKRHDGIVKPPEGVMFIWSDGRIAKLRRDMYDWYVGQRHEGS